MSEKETFLGDAVLWVIMLLAATLTVWGIQLFDDFVWPNLKRFLHLWWLTLAGTVVVFLVGLGLFFFRKYFLKIYGLAEIGFALAVGWTSIMKLQSADANSWVAALAAAYLMVRGLSNYDEGRREQG